MGKNERDVIEEAPVPGLWMTEDDLERRIERDIALLERGLELQELYVSVAEEQEAARDAREENAQALGKTPDYAPTDEERAWDDYHNRALTGIALQNHVVLEVFGLDPRKSSLFSDFPELLARACDPKCPVLYDPPIREFSLMESWGPAVLVIDHCPWSGKALPKSLAGEWSDTISAMLQLDEWSIEEAREKLPAAYFTEEWWIDRGL